MIKKKMDNFNFVKPILLAVVHLHPPLFAFITSLLPMFESSNKFLLMHTGTITETEKLSNQLNKYQIVE